MERKITRENWAMYCGHANECPRKCPCDNECGCRRWGNCHIEDYSDYRLDESLDSLSKRLQDIEKVVGEIQKKEASKPEPEKAKECSFCKEELAPIMAYHYEKDSTFIGNQNIVKYIEDYYCTGCGIRYYYKFFEG